MTGKLISLVPDLMHKRRMKPIELERASGLSHQTITNLSKGSATMSSEVVRVLCCTFGCQPGELRLFVPEEE